VTWLDSAGTAPVAEVAAALGFTVQGDRQSFGPCPGCGEATRANPGRSDPRGRCRVYSGGDGWACCSNGTDGCGAHGDGPGLVAWRLTGGPWRAGDSDTAAKVRAWFVGGGFCDVLAPMLPRPSVPAAPVPARPPAMEVAGLWFGCRNVADDPEVAAYCAGRSFDPAALHDLARALPADGPLPPWARFKGRSWRESGHRLIVAAWEPDPARPGCLRLASLHARCVRPCDDGDKAACPAAGPGSGTGMVLAADDDALHEGEARQLLTICEGVPDFLAWALRPAAMRGALWGSWSGSASAQLATMVPAGWTVALAHHNDEGGDKQAAAWKRQLEARGVRCVRCKPRKAA